MDKLMQQQPIDDCFDQQKVTLRGEFWEFASGFLPRIMVTSVKTMQAAVEVQPATAATSPWHISSGNLLVTYADDYIAPSNYCCFPLQ